MSNEHFDKFLLGMAEGLSGRIKAGRAVGDVNLDAVNLGELRGAMQNDAYASKHPVALAKNSKIEVV